MRKIISILFSKRTLYIVCFLALTLIEVLRASQPGNIWAAAANCTGLVMFAIIVSAYSVKDFMNRFNAIYTVLCAAAMVFVHFHWQQHIGEYLWGQTQTAILNIWWIGMVVRLLFHRVIVEKTLPFKPGKIGWVWIIFMLLMIASVSQRWWPVWFLLMFGSFYLTKYTPQDRDALWDGMINGTILGFFCVQIYAYGFRHYDEVRYTGAFGNSNMAALYYLIIYVMCLAKLHVLEYKKAHKAWKIIYLIGAGGMLSFQIFTMCRTAWIASLVVTLVYGICVVKRIWKKKWHQVIARGSMLVLAVAFTFLPVYYTIRWLPTILHYPVWYEGEYSINKVHSFDPADSEKYVDLDEFLEQVLGRIINTLRSADSANPFVLRAQAVENTYERVELVDVPWADDSMTIRFTIYKAYLKDMTWYGHTADEGYYWIGNSGYHSWHAQNVWLQIAYYFGIPAGILLVMLSILLLCRGTKQLERSSCPYRVIPLLVCVVCFVFGLMEVVWNPGQLIMFLIFFVHHPQMGENTQIME